jgi:putative lipoprotein
MRSGLGAVSLAIVVVLLFSLTPSMAHAGSDRWLGPDKLLHFGACAGIAGAGYGAGAVLSEDRWPRFAIGGGLALSIGVGKELWDLAGHGDPSWRDLAWDVLGTAAGLGIAYGIDRLLSRDSGEPKPAPPPAETVLFPEPIRTWRVFAPLGRVPM